MTEPRKRNFRLYQGTFDIFPRYWRAYGGWHAVLTSFYLHVAVVITLLMSAIWTRPAWWEISITILPGLIGFTLGGYAMLLSFGGERFQNILVKAKVGDISAFVEVSATFTHFIVVQFAALFCALIAKGTYVTPPEFLRQILDKCEPILDWLRLGFWFLGMFLLIYALTTGVAATMRIFRLSENFVMTKPRDGNKPEQTTPSSQSQQPPPPPHEPPTIR